jgi:hypothetical protein
VLFAVLAGCLWGAIGYAIARQGFGPPVWGGVVAAPLIGLAIAFVFRGFRERSPGARIALSLVSLYLASGLFALAVGITDAARPIADRNGGAVVIQTVLAVWWGVTFTVLLPVLWALAYFTHALLGRADSGGPRNARAPAGAPLVAPELGERAWERVRGPNGGDATFLRGLAIGAAGVAGVLLLLRLLHQFRQPLGELAVLLVGAGFLVYGGRAAWRWWKPRQLAVAPVGVLGAFGVTGAGWALVAIVHALSNVSSENYGMIVVWPFVFLAASVLIVAGVLASAVGVAAVVTAASRRPPKGALIALGGAVAAALNLLHVVALTRMVFTG